MRSDKNSKRVLGISLWLVLIAFIVSVPLVPMSIDKGLSAPFLDSSGSSSALVFFGFRGCSDICPTTMVKLRELANLQKSAAVRTQVFFVDIDAHSDTEQASNYASQFHPSFVGLHFEPLQLSKISYQFGLNIKANNAKIYHLGKTYLLRRVDGDWRLLKSYSAKVLSVAELQHELVDRSELGGA